MRKSNRILFVNRVFVRQRERKIEKRIQMATLSSRKTIDEDHSIGSEENCWLTHFQIHVVKYR